MYTVKIVFWVVAFLASLFYGTRATKIFNVNIDKMPFSWKFHQFWFNFLGSLAGWILAYSFVPDIYDSIVNNSKFELSLARILIFILAFIGMSGHLPYAMMTIINYLKTAFDKLFDKLKN
jgi:hypothetical protein